MTDLTDPSPSTDLARRPAGASVIAACLAAQAKLLPRRRLADVLGVSPLADEAVPWFTGAIGELEVGRELARLDPSAGWTVLHAVPVGRRESDIDHVVIGPAGVFTINTKHHAGKRVSVGRNEVFVSGRNGHYVKNSAFEANRASDLLTAAAGLDVVAQPVLVFVDAREIAGKREVGGVQIVDASRLVRWLTKQPTSWDSNAAARVARAAEHGGTWRAAASDFGADTANVAAFAQLRRQVALMSRIRALWALCGALSVAAAGYGGLDVLFRVNGR